MLVTSCLPAGGLTVASIGVDHADLSLMLASLMSFIFCHKIICLAVRDRMFEKT